MPIQHILMIQSARVGHVQVVLFQCRRQPRETQILLRTSVDPV